MNPAMRALAQAHIAWAKRHKPWLLHHTSHQPSRRREHSDLSEPTLRTETNGKENT